MLISSFTQTYGNNRLLEIELLKYDKVGNYFRNKCDLIIFSFHNCPKEFIIKSKQILQNLYPKEKLLLLKYNNITYLETIRKTLYLLQNKKIDYVFQIQDDHHGINSKQNIKNIRDIDDIFKFLENKKVDFLHIFSDEGNKYKNGLTPHEEVEIDSTEFYSYDTRLFQSKNTYAWNDGAYFGKLDFLIKLFNLNLPDDVWGIEITLKNVFDNHYLIRWGINKLYFKASNIHGRNINQTPVEKNLGRFFGELPDWDKIKLSIKNQE